MAKRLTLEILQEHVGKEIGLSDWMEITQERINAFAESTEDRQWIHVNPLKAKFGPFRKTIAHGFLILSLLAHLSSNIELLQKGIKMMANVGMNRVRFINPVLVGSKIRNRTVLKDATEKSSGKILITVENTVEIEGAEKPALVAEVLALLII
ncbi:MAG: MaoC family dehydratase [Candidatus Aminicenantaceae bacterium]